MFSHDLHWWFSFYLNRLLFLAFLAISWRSILVLTIGILIYRSMRHASAATRHFALAATLGVLVIWPILHSVLPQWRVPLHHELIHPEPIIIHHYIGIKSSSSLPVTPEKSNSNVLPLVPVSQPIHIDTKGIDNHAPWIERWSFYHSQAIIIGAIVFWLLGASFVAIRLLYSIWKTSYLIYDHSDIDTNELELPDIPEYVTLVWNPNISVPITLGIFRSILILPSVAATWSSAQLRSVILHELAHIERKDCLTQLFTQIVCAIYWYNPLVWWVARQIRTEAENACDDRVLTQGVAATDYAEHLIEIAKLVRSLKFGPTVVAMAHQSKISERVNAILDQTRTRNPINTNVLLRTMVAGVPILILFAIFTPLFYVQPQYPSDYPRTQAYSEIAAHEALFAVNPYSLWTRHLPNGTMAELVSVSGRDPITGSRATWSPYGVPMSWSTVTSSYVVDHITAHLKFPSKAIEMTSQATFGLTEQAPYALDWVGNDGLTGQTEITEQFPASAKTTDAVLVMKPMTILGYSSPNENHISKIYGGMLQIEKPKKRLFVNGFGKQRYVVDVDVVLPKFYTDSRQYEDWLDAMSRTQSGASIASGDWAILKHDSKTATLRFTFRDADLVLAQGVYFRCYVRQRYVIHFQDIALKPNFTKTRTFQSQPLPDHP